MSRQSRHDDATVQSIATSVPEDVTPADRCPFCDRPFPTERLCALHLGERHERELDTTQRERFESASDTETDELFVYHLKIVAAFICTFFGFTYVYVFIWI
ncbi:DUF7410 domain-containing protein [Halocatena halophila]|uniref:DUF7410 domain-containing protein n=1 Tax=Halocatena halophila TaxID=2814576 RepID=UPI002ED58A5D